MACLSVSLLVLFLTYTNCSPSVEYYKKLIEENIEKSKSFKSVQYKTEFENGVNSNKSTDFGTFDFIIVGAGTAGSVLATRLSEIDNFKILLLEAGGEEDDFNQINGMGSFVLSSEKNWALLTTPQNNSCLTQKEQKCSIASGKVIGGSSSINGMGYTRGNSYDYEQWAKLGNPAWSYKHVLPYFIKSENSQINGDQNFHGKGGLWNVEYSDPINAISKKFFQATAELGLNYVEDYNGKKQIGSSRLQYTHKKGKRQSTGTAFLDMARKRRNLKVVTQALATRVLFNSKKIATGVEFVTSHEKFTALAKKEVILSAGALHSPQILMLSGIGPRRDLEKLGIQVIVDLPVGLNFRDQPFVTLQYHLEDKNEELSLETKIQQYLEGYGVLTKLSGCDAITFTNFGNRKAVPTIEYLLRFQNILENEQNGTTVSIPVALLHEKSKGRITLKTKNILDYPEIDPNFLSEQDDVDLLVRGIEFALKIFNTTMFQNAKLKDFTVCMDLEKFSKIYWECVVRHMTGSFLHIFGTTQMGSNPKSAVVDSKLKVYGVRNLRVVDAGVFPSGVSGHTMATAVMVAERAADFIKKSYVKNSLLTWNIF